MSIIIKGMEMPTAQYGKMVITLYPNGHVAEYIGDIGRVWEAVPVPPHGRLIDADALKEIEFHGMQADKKISYQMGWNDAIATIAENAPTIIEADILYNVPVTDIPGKVDYSENDDEVGRGWEKMR